MDKLLRTSTVILALLFVAAGTVCAQEKKQVEKKIRIVTVDGQGVRKDTLIISGDTLDIEDENLVINTDDERVLVRKGRGNRMIMIDREGEEPVVMRGPLVRPMRPPVADQKAQEGVNYHLSIDGVTVNIRAPKDKIKEADLILAEVRKILTKK